MKKDSNVLTLTGGGGSRLNRLTGESWPYCHAELVSASVQCNRKSVTRDRSRNKFGMTIMGFTMAEILLSLTIIGVVAAITLPSLTGNINERTWNTQRKALYARMSQAIALMPALNGYGTLTEDASGSVTEDTAAETFVTEGLSKVLKINNICDADHLEDCGIANQLTNLAGSTISSFPKTLVELNSMFNGTACGGAYFYSQLDTKAAAFETQNGESIVVYYNPNCVSDLDSTSTFYTQGKMCANFIYDLNGNKGPNTVGKDIGFMTAFYPSDSIVVAPLPLMTNAGSAKQKDAGALCQKQDSESRLPNREEAISMFYNKNLIGLTTGNLWTSSVISVENAWMQGLDSGNSWSRERSQSNPVRCVKR